MAKKQLSRDRVAARNLRRYQLFSNVLSGADRLLRCPAGTQHPISGYPITSYLYRLPGERTDKDGRDPYLARLYSSAGLPFCAEVLDTYVDTLAHQGVDRTAVAERLPQVVGETDQARTRTQAWVMGAYGLGLAQGWMAALVDAPPVDPGQYPSQAHLEAAGLRPWVQLLLPRRFWQLEQDRDGTVTYALIQESEKRWGEWRPGSGGDPGTYRALDRGGMVLDQRQLRTGRIPIEIFTAAPSDPDDEYAPPGQSVIRDSAIIEIQALQHLSWIHHLVETTGYALLHVERDAAPADEGAEEDTQVGPGYMLAIGAAVNWKAPPADLLRVLWEHVRNLRLEVYRISGINERAHDKAEASSGIAIAYERAPIHAKVARWAGNLQDWEIRVWRLVAELSGLDPDGIEVAYPDDFTEHPSEQDLGYAERLAAIYGGYAAAPPLVKAGIDAHVQRVLRRSVGHFRVVQEALRAVELAPIIPPAAFTPTGIQVPKMAPVPSGGGAYIGEDQAASMEAM